MKVIVLMKGQLGFLFSTGNKQVHCRYLVFMRKDSANAEIPAFGNMQPVNLPTL